MWKLTFCLLFFSAVCLGEEIRVTRCILPRYPAFASISRIQGTVRVHAEIRREDGKVLSAKGTLITNQPRDRLHQELVSTAEENLRQWIFSPSYDPKNRPMKHSVEYVFKVKGKRVDNPKPRYSIVLPDRVKITTQPYLSIPGVRGTILPLREEMMHPVPLPELIPPKSEKLVK